MTETKALTVKKRSAKKVNKPYRPSKDEMLSFLCPPQTVDKYKDKIFGIHRERDFNIVWLLANGFSQTDVCRAFDLTQPRVSNVYRENYDVFLSLQNMSLLNTSAGRCHYAQLQVRKSKGSNRDPLDWIKVIQDEHKENTPYIQVSFYTDAMKEIGFVGVEDAEIVEDDVKPPEKALQSNGDTG